MKTIPNYTPFQFQYASIDWHIKSVINNNGTCILDETGLGKTISAATVAINVTDEYILVISQNANRSSWIEVFTAAQAKFVVCTSAKIQDGKYGVVIVDEAHNFKNIKSKSYLELFRIIKTNQAKVLLLTATAFQNKVSELKTMASLIHFHTNTPAFILLGSLFKMVKASEKILDNQERYVGAMGDAGFSFGQINILVENEQKIKYTLANLGNIFATFSHRNTRQDIEVNYSQDVELMGRFPKKNTKLIEYGSNPTFQQKFHLTVKMLNNMPYVMQNIYNYSPIKRKGEMTSMGGIMRSFLLKRLDSSVYAFKKSLDNAYNKLMSIAKTRGSRTVLIDDEEVEVIDKFWQDYPKDCQLFLELIEMWRNEKDTIKVDLLFNELKGQKCVIFTEYKDTLDMLLEEATKRKISKVFGFSGTSSEADLEKIRNNFDANLPQNINTIDVLITTDVLSEGVNLHVSKELIHFDQKWNPSKTTQRNGRIDRILKNGLVTDILITSFGIDAVIESILELEKTINHKQYMADIFMENLNTPSFYIIPKFEHDKVLFYSDELYNETLHCCRTYMGDIMMEAGPIQFLTSHDVRLSHFDPTKTKCEVLLKKSKADFPRQRSMYFKNLLETTSFLYNETYEQIVKKETDIRNVKEQGGFNQMMSDIHNIYKTESREPLQSCVIWTTSHRFMNWF